MFHLDELLRRTSPQTDFTKARVVRHLEPRTEGTPLSLFNMFYGDRQTFEQYQATQQGQPFSSATHIVSTLGLPNSESLVVGVYEVLGETKGIHPEALEPLWSANQLYTLYNLRLCDEFEALSGRVVVDWGQNTRTWCQKNLAKPVVELRRAHSYRPFDSYDATVLDFGALKRILTNGPANPTWQTALSAVSGVYLIVDTSTGQQYIGSACGAGGIWARWKCYAETNCVAGNVALEQLFLQDPAFGQNMRFSILQTLSKTATKRDVVSIEQRFKEKLGTRAHGLNRN